MAKHFTSTAAHTQTSNTQIGATMRGVLDSGKQTQQSSKSCVCVWIVSISHSFYKFSSGQKIVQFYIFSFLFGDNLGCVGADLQYFAVHLFD